MNAPALAELAAIKQGARATWAAGTTRRSPGASCGRSARGSCALPAFAPGDEVLDMACGTGNAALRAAQAGARITGVDLTPDLFDTARRLAADAGVQIEWVQGDAEELPFDDASFDVVLSTFGCMFAPRHAVTANELARVLRPGGRLAVTAWTPDGGVGRSFRTVGAYLPPPLGGATAARRRRAARRAGAVAAALGHAGARGSAVRGHGAGSSCAASASW